MHVKAHDASVTVTGELALDATHDLAHLADDLQALAAAHTAVTLDLAGVTFIDSAGLGVLVAAAHTARENGSHLQITATSQRVRAILTATRLDSLLD